MAVTREYRNSLRVVLRADEVCRIITPFRTLMIITMASDEASVTVQSVPYTQVSYLGNTGLGNTTPTPEQLGTTQGVDHDIRPHPQDDIRGDFRL